MDDRNQHEGSKIPFWKWIVAILFPPYAFHLLFSKTRFYKFIQIPLIILFLLVLVAAVDSVLNPYRVEEDLVKEIVVNFIDRKGLSELETFRKAERVGVFSWEEKNYLLYRVLTTSGSYDFIILPKEENEYTVDAVYKTHPDEKWVEKNHFILPPRVMDSLTNNSKKIGDIEKVWEEDKRYFIKTSKGEYRLLTQFGQLLAVVDESDEHILQQSPQYTLPEKAVRYFEKNKEELGEIKEVFDYEFKKDKESFHVLTDTDDWFRVDVFDNGAIEFLKADMRKNLEKMEK